VARLFIRPDRQDTHVVQDVLAPGGGPRRFADEPPVSALVIDATTAESRPEFAGAAATAGVPALIDPLTFGLQIAASPSSQFAALPYAAHASTDASSIRLDHLVSEVIEHQLNRGATGIVLPYFHIRELDDGWDVLSLRALDAAARARDAMGLHLGSMAVLSGNRRALSSEAGLRFVDRIVSLAVDCGVDVVAVCVSPAGQPRDSYDGVARSAAVLERACATGVPTIAWRQGAYGLAFTALGADGYECGIGQGEASDIAALQGRIRTHQPLEADGDFRRPRRAVYFTSWQRSVPLRAAQVILTNPSVQGEVLCDVPGCCPTASDTVSRQRHHAVRARAHQLAELSKQPERWRLQHLLQELKAARGAAQRANEVLERAGESYRVPLDNLTAQIDYLAYKQDLNRGRLSA